MKPGDRSRWFLFAGMFLLLGCGSEDGTFEGQGGAGGTAASGGAAGSGGRGGSAGSVDNSGTGGTTGTGGKATGGSAGSGGTGASGGGGGSGGTAGSGGLAGSGGQSTGTGGFRLDGGSGGVVIDGGFAVDSGFGGGAGTGGNPGTGGGGAAGSCGTPTPAQAPSGATPLRAIDGFVTKSGSQLTLCGEPFTVLGSNLYYLQSYSVYEAGNLRTVADGLDDSVRMSLPVARMWAFYDGSAGSDTAVIQTEPGKFSETALVGLDTAIAEAKKRGIRVILTLTNYWDGYGGLPQYAKWAGAANADAFYTNATMKGYFKDYAAMLSERTNTVTKVAYKDEPAILAWEIANELRCPSCSDASPVTSTIDELSKFLKLLFPNHLIADGGEGMDDQEENWGTFTNNYPVSGWERTSFTDMVALEALDMVSFHYYPIDWGLKESGAGSDGKLWIEGHHALAKAAGKVAYWGEFGYERGASDATRAPIYDDWLSVFFSPPSDGTIALFWQLVPQTRGADDGFACILGRDPKTVEVFDKYAEPRAPR